MDSCFEASLFADPQEGLLIAGVDEVGRGCIFGSVVAAAVVLPLSRIPQLIELGVKDSKKLSTKRREELVKPIKQIVSGWQIKEASVTEIDRLNILQASLLAMNRTVDQLKPSPDLCLVDGKFPIPRIELKQKTVIKGDALSSAIAAASILAKVWRDRAICNLAAQYPDYDLINNKGYPTPKHKLAIQTYGISDLHRKTFAPCRDIALRRQ